MNSHVNEECSMLADIPTWMICKVDFTDVKTAGYLYKSSPPRCVLHQKQLFIVSSELSLPEERNDLLFVMCVWCSISALTSVTLIRVLDRSAWHIQPFLSLLHAHRRFIGGGGGGGGGGIGYICSSTFALTRQLTSVNYSFPESNTFSLCQAISLCSLTRVGGNKTVIYNPPQPHPQN